jgi:hypothetical protein
MSLDYEDGFMNCGRKYNIYISQSSGFYEETSLSNLIYTDENSKHSQYKHNIIAINEGREDDITFKDFPIRSVLDLPDDDIRQHFLSTKFCKQSDKIPTIRFFLGKKAGSYFRALAEDSQDQCDTIWNDQVKFYLDSACNIAIKMRNQPIFQNLSSKDHVSNYHVIISIFYERFVVFYYGASSYNCPKEIIKILCDYWIETEVFSARKRLFDLVPQIEPQNNSPQQLNVVEFDGKDGLYRTVDYDFIISQKEFGIVVIGRYSEKHQCVMPLSDPEKIVVRNMGLIIENNF